MFSISDAWDAAKAKHKKYVLEKIKAALDVQPGQPEYISSKFLREFVDTNKNAIACGADGELRRLIAEYVDWKKTATDADVKLFKEDANVVFNYSYFSGKKVRIWCAYALCKSSPYKVCPYCNQNFAFTLIAKDNEFRPTLDHYYSKAEYPFLAISLYNLVPSCYTCNSNLKGKKNFYAKEHVYPFDVSASIKFRVEGKGGKNIELFLDDEPLFMKNGRLVTDDAKGNSAVENSISTFLLDERFENSETDFLKFAFFRKRLTPGRVQEFSRILNLPVNESYLLRFDPVEYKNEIHGKIYLDIFNQFKPD